MGGAWRLTAVNVAARAAHLLLFLAIGNRYGASELTDTLFLLQVPLVVAAGLMASGAELVVMPAVHRAAAAGAATAMVLRLLRNAVAAVLPATLVALAAAAVLADGTPRLDLLALLAPIPAAATVSAVAVGVLHAHGRHRRAVLGPVYGSLAAGAVLVTAPTTATALAAVLMLFEVARAAVLAADAGRLLPRPWFGPAAAAAVPAELSAWPAGGALLSVAAAALASINLLVDVVFASRLGEGAVTQVEYASRLWNAVPLLLSGHLLLIHARLSRDAAAAEAGAARSLHRSALALGAAGFAVSLLAAALTPWGIELLFGFGRLGAAQRDVLARLLTAYLFGAGPFLAGVVYVRGLAAAGRHRAVVLVATGSVVVNVTFNALLIGPYGVVGIGISTALTYGVNAATFALFARR